MIKSRLNYLIICLISTTLLAHQKTEFLKLFINPGDFVLDVGANVGEKTELYLEVGAIVLAIEPQPNCCAKLRKKFINQPVTILQKGLADKIGTFTMGICSQADTISTFSKEWQESSRFTAHGYKWDKQIEVKTTTLDALIAEYGIPQYCKIDVENFEYEVLQGLTHLIPFLSFEFNIETNHNTRKCLEHLCSLGYKEFNFAIAEHPRFILEKWVDAETLLQQLKYYDSLPNNGALWGLWGDVYARS